MAYFNLLSANHRQTLHDVQWNRILRHLGIGSVVLAVSASALLWVGARFVSQGVAEVTAVPNPTQQRFYGNITALNALAQHTLARDAEHVYWSEALVELADIVPPDVVITSLQINAETAQLQVAGTARERSGVLQLERNLQDSIYFSDVRLPLQAIAQKNDIDFTVMATVDAALLQ